MSKVKTPFDDDVKKAMEAGDELPEGTVLNFYTPNKFEDRSVEDLVAHATQNNPKQEKSSSSRTSKSTEPTSTG